MLHLWGFYFIFPMLGGALLGQSLAMIVSIKSTYPNGMFGFQGQTQLTISNPASLMSLALAVNRTGGTLSEQSVRNASAGSKMIIWIVYV